MKYYVIIFDVMNCLISLGDGADAAHSDPQRRAVDLGSTEFDRSADQSLVFGTLRGEAIERTVDRRAQRAETVGQDSAALLPAASRPSRTALPSAARPLRQDNPRFLLFERSIIISYSILSII